jgi:putative hemolysin
VEIAILFVLILLNGAFAMSEIALVSARKARLQRYLDDGDKAATVAVRLHQEPTHFLSTVQIGITSISILNGIIGDAVLSEPVSIWLQSYGMEPRASQIAATALVVVTITYFSIVLGELVPKRLGQLNPEEIARRVAIPIDFLAKISKPFVKLLAGSTNLVLRLLGVTDQTAPVVTEEEIHALLVEGSDAGVIEHHEHAMARNVLRLDDRPAGLAHGAARRHRLPRRGAALGGEREDHRGARALALSRGARRPARRDRAGHRPRCCSPRRCAARRRT